MASFIKDASGREIKVVVVNMPDGAVVFLNRKDATASMDFPLAELGEILSSVVSDCKERDIPTESLRQSLLLAGRLLHLFPD